jgi:pyruvate/2-oxoglutarate/acetoin dehydrogenase E1 component
LHKVIVQEGQSALVNQAVAIKPLDIATLAQSVRKTHRVVLVEEGPFLKLSENNRVVV